MDLQVEKAVAKWPNVPHCYGWLMLDARGTWRMRDENAQRHNLRGDKITQPALLGFINRNYVHDKQGCWYFQNGPQRVYVDLEAAPYVAHTEPVSHFVLQTREPLPSIETAWLSNQGRLWLQNADKIAIVDDRDLTQCLLQLHCMDRVVTDEELVAWLDSCGACAEIKLIANDSAVDVRYLDEEDAARQFGFVRQPGAVITANK